MKIKSFNKYNIFLRANLNEMRTRANPTSESKSNLANEPAYNNP